MAAAVPMMSGQQPASASGALQNRAEQAIGRARTMMGGPRPIQPMTKPLARPGMPPGATVGPTPPPEPPMMRNAAMPASATVGPEPRRPADWSDHFPISGPGSELVRPTPDLLAAMKARWQPGGPWMGGGRLPTGPDWQHPDFPQPAPPPAPLEGGGMRTVQMPEVQGGQPPMGASGAASPVDVGQLPPKLQAMVAAGMDPQVAYQRAMMFRPGFAAAQGAQGLSAPNTSLMDIYNRLQQGQGGGPQPLSPDAGQTSPPWAWQAYGGR